MFFFIWFLSLGENYEHMLAAIISGASWNWKYIPHVGHMRDLQLYPSLRRLPHPNQTPAQLVPAQGYYSAAWHFTDPWTRGISKLQKLCSRWMPLHHSIAVLCYDSTSNSSNSTNILFGESGSDSEQQSFPAYFSDSRDSRPSSSSACCLKRYPYMLYHSSINY